MELLAIIHGRYETTGHNVSLSFGVCRVSPSLFSLFESASMLTNRDDLILSFKSVSMPSLCLKHQTVFIESAVALVVRYLPAGKECQ